eukprot:GFYU01001893.1.p1 GENE.GFYU01001893.1~~GFYU01001893.1.p1  ORF type:complete len:276 (-),score=77.65 GFYU01001893.1:188-1015(-)
MPIITEEPEEVVPPPPVPQPTTTPQPSASPAPAAPATTDAGTDATSSTTSSAPPAATEGSAEKDVQGEGEGEGEGEDGEVVEEPFPVCEEDEGHIKDEVEKATGLKNEGNALYSAGETDEAIEKYTEGLDAIITTCTHSASIRSVCFCNRAAARLKLGQHRFVVEDCTEALRLNPEYIKAYLRRSQAHENMSKLKEALDDMKKVQELEPTSSEAKSNIPRLTRALEAQHEKEKEEMMGKLKDLGNNLLGKFGLSLDNFKADKDPTTGSYNISFQK